MESLLSNLVSKETQSHLFTCDANILMNFETGQTIAISLYNSLGWVRIYLSIYLFIYSFFYLFIFDSLFTHLFIYLYFFI
jgi:hypothetical protein